MTSKTPKSILYELLMINLCPHNPIFATIKIGGSSHAPIYQSTVTIMGWKMGFSKSIPNLCGLGQGRSKKLAEHEASVAALLELKKVNGLAWPEIHVTPKASYIPLFMPVYQPEPQTALMLIEVGDMATAEFAEFASGIARNTDVY